VIATLRGAAPCRRSTLAASQTTYGDASWGEVTEGLWSMPRTSRTECLVPVRADDRAAWRDELRRVGYPDFGLYIYRSARVFLSIRCGPVGQGGRGGHAHNDQVAVELQVDGRDEAADPGTYLYSPLPAQRNAYRSVRAHAAPRALDAGEPGGLGAGLVRLEDRAEARCIYFGGEGFVGSHYGFGAAVYRVIDLTHDAGIRIVDIAQPPARLAGPLSGAGAIALSPGYGVVRAATPARE
jgi:hypothetical protein